METRSFNNYTAKWTFRGEDYYDDDNEDYDSDEEDGDYVLSVDFYKDDVLIYTLKRNNYHTERHDFKKLLLLEYFEIDGKVFHIFSLEHGAISVINADTGVEIHQSVNNDVFIEDYKLFDNREYMYISGWVWTPMPVRFIYHIPTLLKDPEYKPIHIPGWDHDLNKDDRFGCRIDLYGCSTVKEFLDRKDEIAFNIKVKQTTDIFNENIDKSTLLSVFLNDDSVIYEGDAKERLSLLLKTQQDKFYVKAYGINSGKHLNRFDRCLFTEIIYDDTVTINNDMSKIQGNKQKPSKMDNLTFLCSKILCDNYIRAIPTDGYYLRFEIHGNVNLTILYNQKLIWNNNVPLTYDCKRYNVDEANPCNVVIK